MGTIIVPSHFYQHEINRIWKLLFNAKNLYQRHRRDIQQEKPVIKSKNILSTAKPCYIIEDMLSNEKRVI